MAAPCLLVALYEACRTVDGVASKNFVEGVLRREATRRGRCSSMHMIFLAQNRRLTCAQYNTIASLEIGRPMTVNRGVIGYLADNPSVSHEIKNKIKCLHPVHMCIKAL